MKLKQFGSIILFVSCFILLPLTADWPLARGSTYPQAFIEYVDSNTRFGTKLFKELHSATPEKNVVYSPIGISALLAYLREGTFEEDKRSDLNVVFDWLPDQSLSTAHRIFMERCELPQQILGQITDELWMKNSLLYHSSFVLNAFDQTLGRAKDDFGIEYVKLEKDWKAALSEFPNLQKEFESNRKYLFLLKSILHLDTKWPGNTFILHHPKPADFYLSSGSKVSVRTLISELKGFRHGNNAAFEAIVVPAQKADFIVLMPAEGISIFSLEDSLVRDPNLLTPILQTSFGDVEMPQFNFSSYSDIKPLLKQIGLRKTFESFNSNGLMYKLLGVLQGASILVDQVGIHAEARTYSYGVVGGMTSGEKPFHMKVNRPFIFQVRDRVTGMLLFMGAVMDPSKN